MPTPTANSHFNKPDIGADTDWGETLNTDLDGLDTWKQAYDTNLGALNTNATLVANGHNATTPAAVDALISDEVADARGAAGSLDARISVSLDANGSLISGVAAADQWLATSMTSPTYVSAATFTVTVDVTSILYPGKPLKIDYSSSDDRFYRVKSASYGGGLTTVTIWDDDPAILDEAMTAAYYQSYAAQQIPDLNASDFTPGAFPADYVSWMSSGSSSVYYYNASAYDDPFNTTGSRVAQTNGGDVANIQYSSGMKVGYVYASLGGNLTTATYYIMKAGVDTAFSVRTFTYDGTTGNVTDVDRT